MRATQNSLEPRTRGNRKAAAGSALLIVLWTIAVLALIAASFVRTTRVDALLARNAADLAAARLLADAGVKRGILALIEARHDGRLAATISSARETGHREIPLLRSDERLEVDGVPYQWRFLDSSVGIAFVSEAGKVNLNLAPMPILRAGFEALGAGDPDALAADIDRYRRSVRDGGSAASPAGGSGFSQRGRWQLPFRSVEDLAAVTAFPRDLTESAADIFTVYSTSAIPEPGLAPPRLQAALGVRSNNQAASIAMPVMSIAGQASDARLSAFPEIGGGQGALVYGIRATAHVGRAVFVREAVVELARDGDVPFRTYRWAQGEIDSGETAPVR